MRAIGIVLLLVSATTAGASCYTNNMSTYNSATTDGTNVVVTAVADGTYAMCEIPPGYPPNYIRHTTSSRITLKSPKTGAQKTGSGSTTACPSCYVSVGSSAQMPIGSDSYWTASWNDSVTCNIAGVVWSPYGDIFISYGFSRADYYYSYKSPPGYCWYGLSCPAGTTPSCVVSGGYLIARRDPGTQCDTTFDHVTHDVWISIDGGVTKYCSQISPVTFEITPPPCF